MFPRLLAASFLLLLCLLSPLTYANLPPIDTDGDGYPDNVDACPLQGNQGWGVDATGCPNPIPDTDGDGYLDDVDSCPFAGDQGWGVDATGCPNAIPDSDGDGYFDDVDSCPFAGDQGWGVDGSGCPYADSDGDGYYDNVDSCPFAGDQGYGLDGSGCPYGPPSDSDGDGYYDNVDACPFNGNEGYGVDWQGCPYGPPGDSDGDGYNDFVDSCPFNGDEGYGVDWQGCPNAVPDTDGDGYLDNVDACPNDGDQGYGVDSSGCPIAGPSVAVAGDTDADGFGDVVTWNTNTGNGYQYLMSSNNLRASTPNSGVPFAGFLPSAYTQVALADFNHDFTQDMLLRNNSNGTWAMIEYALGSPGAVAMNVPMSTSLTDVFVAAADFNGDGYKDVLLRNSATGMWTLNLLQGDIVLSSSTVVASALLDWQFVAAADLNGDGNADLLLRSTATQQWYLYELSGATVLRSGALAMASTGWNFVGTGDFNADGVQDVMLRRASDGVWYEYAFNNYATAATTRFFSSGAVGLATSAAWQVLALADVDGSGSTDLLLYRASDRVHYLYGMGGESGRSVVGATVLPMTNNVDWSYQTKADYNGDGKLDFLMRNTVTGKWHMYGFNSYTAGAVWSFYGFATSLTSDLNAQVVK